jgi:hypothetical protein
VPTATEQTADLIDALSKIAWPLVLIIFILKFQGPLRNLLSKASRVKAAGVELEFEERTRDVLDELSDAQLPLPPAEQTVLTELAKANPRLAINLSWARVRDASARLASAVGISSQVTVRRIERLARRGYATEEMVSLAKTLKGTQTAVVSQPDVEPPRDLAEAFVAGALSLAQWFEKNAPIGRGTPRPSVPPSGTPPSDYPPSDYPPSGTPPSDYPPSGSPPDNNLRSKGDGEPQEEVDSARDHNR